MNHLARLASLFSLVALACATHAYAQEGERTPTTADPASAAAPAVVAPPLTAAVTETAPVEETPAVAATAAKPKGAGKFGLAARWRWVTVPGWFLGLFAEENVPLSTFNCWALEGFWRKPDKETPNRTWEVVVSVGYQNMSPPDGYWLGRGKDPASDADLVQAKGLGLITLDAAFVVRQYFSRYFGIHYGAGLGLGIVRGRVLRTSARHDPATGQFSVVDAGGRTVCDQDANCNETLLTATQGQEDLGPDNPHRFEEDSVPGALPILNILAGLDFPIPDAKGLEFRLEGGFYDAFFVGLGAGYAF